MDYNYDIKITGNGTREQIIEDLKSFIEGLEAETSVAVLDGAEWESESLFLEINQKEYVKK